jgi:hypothetical protein
MGEYTKEAISDAQDTARNFIEEIAENFRTNDTVSDDLNNDYPNGDSYHHESHIDKDYSLSEAAELLDELSDHEETDKGLWEGCEPRRAIACQAAFTYGNAVYHYWKELIEDINEKREEFFNTVSAMDFADELELTKEQAEQMIGKIIDRFDG